MRLAIATAQRAYAGEMICGDAFAVVRGERTLIALADGLGHGAAAAHAAEVFCRSVEQRPERGLAALFEGAAEEMSRTRGAAAALLRIDSASREIEFAGIGNIELQAVSLEPIRPVSVPGIVGRRVRKVRVFGYRLHRGDLLVAYTDGISSRFVLADYAGLGEQELADTVLERHGKLHDDATCLVVRCE